MQPLKNLPQVARNLGNNVLNQPGFFRDQSLILASFALVLSRIVVANISALKSVGTPEGPFRYRESIRTDMREIGGFGMGFLVLRLVQWGVKKGLRSHLGITERKLDSDYPLKNAWRDLTTKEKPAPVRLKLTWDSFPRIAEDQLSPLAQKISDVFEAPVLKSLKHKATAHVKTEGLSEAEKLLVKNKAFITEGVYKIAPILISSIPTVALAGYLLERVTRDHSEKIVDAVSKRIGTQSKSPHAPSSFATPPEPLPMANPPQFGVRPFTNPYAVSAPSAMFASPRL
ncbi:hypothetical protein [Vampirovibrio sp.]|uniref:hypothetical protein n=1 Tax=Vampirovibrio sp. TaxID=2717857 RepID=UPI0035941E1A